VKSSPPALAAYCAAVRERRAAFHLDLKFEVRAASLLPREGYQPRTLVPEEQAVVAQAQIFLGRESTLSADDLAGAQIRPASLSDGRYGDERYDVLLRVKSANTIAPRLQPLVGGTVAVIVNERLLSLVQLETAVVRWWPLAYGLALEEARIAVARVSPPPDAAGLQGLEERCLGGESALCLALAEERLLGCDAPYDAERALKLFEAACRQGMGVACSRAAKLARDPEQAALLLDHGCRLNDSDACLETATRFLRSRATPTAKAEGRQSLTRLCDRGVGQACLLLVKELGRDHTDAAAPPIETQKTLLHLIERGCSGGAAEACFWAAKLATQGTLGPPDADAARRWMRAGCTLDRSGGTAQLELYLAGAEPALSGTMREAGCTGELAPPTPIPSLCGSEDPR